MKHHVNYLHSLTGKGPSRAKWKGTSGQLGSQLSGYNCDRQVWLKVWPSLKGRLQNKHRPIPSYLTRCLRGGERSTSSPGKLDEIRFYAVS